MAKICLNQVFSFFAITVLNQMLVISRNGKGSMQMFVKADSSSTPCADSVQRCGVLVDEFERQLDGLRKGAFRRCFTNQACVHERVAFDECYEKAIQSVRAPFGDSPLAPNNEFLAAAEAYRERMNSCFTRETVADDAASSASESSAEPVYARAVFGQMDLDDQLWGFVVNNDSAAGLLSAALGECLSIGFSQNRLSQRVFGGGANRLVEPSASSGGFNVSCTLPPSEMECYRNSLASAPEYQLLTSGRDKALRSCVQNVRNGAAGGTSQCKRGSLAAIRSCVCASRTELDARFETALLDCVKHSSVAQLYSALAQLSSGEAQTQTSKKKVLTKNEDAESEGVSLTNESRSTSIASTKKKAKVKTGAEGELFAMTDSSPGLVVKDENETATSVKRQKKVKEAPATVISSQLAEESLSVPATTTLTQGTLVSGQCMCACPKPATTYTVCVPKTVTQPTAAIQAAQDAKPVAVAANQPTSARLPWYYRPAQTVYNTETGIATGFERFFSGLPP